MSMMEAQTLDMSSILMQAYEVSDLIKSSAEMTDYLYWKHRMHADDEVKELLVLFAKKKELFEECERFGHFHPNYHAALEEVQLVQNRMDELESIRRYKEAEKALDDMLFQVSQTIAYSVSETIKVPSNNAAPTGGGCSSGGSCSGKCG